MTASQHTSARLSALTESPPPPIMSADRSQDLVTRGAQLSAGQPRGTTGWPRRRASRWSRPRLSRWTSCRRPPDHDWVPRRPRFPRGEPAGSPALSRSLHGDTPLAVSTSASGRSFHRYAGHRTRRSSSRLGTRLGTRAADRLRADRTAPAPKTRKPPTSRRFPNGETRTRTGDTTIFRQSHAHLELVQKACKSAGSANSARSLAVR
jgi:hypothetical protein